MSTPSRRLMVSLCASVALHGAVAVLSRPPSLSRPMPRIEVRLPLMPEIPADSLLKNTLPGEDAKVHAPAALSRSPESSHTGMHAEAQHEAQQEKQRQRLAAHVFYPPQAVEQGLEGEVRLLLRLDANGKLLDARVASSSGHEILDRAAVAAAYATGAFPGKGAGSGAELILPVIFRLSE